MNLYDKVMKHEGIYTLMYSPIRVAHRTLEEQIIFVPTSQLEWPIDENDREEFIYVWGYPGPDYNKYTIETYGKGWAFTKEEIIKAWKECEE